MQPYCFGNKKYLFKDEDYGPQTKHTGSNYKHRKSYRRCGNKSTRSKSKQMIIRHLKQGVWFNSDSFR